SFVAAAPTEGQVLWTGRRWRLPSTVGAKTRFAYVTDGGLDARARGQAFFLACAPPARLGKASAYLLTFFDRDGKILAGERTYRLHVPANVPASQFWAATVYDAATAGFVHDAARVEVNSFAANLLRNPDGSVDLDLGPKPLPGREANWAAT